MQLITLGDLKLTNSDFKRPKALFLLAFLALEGAQERSYLAELFWLGQENALRNLSMTLSRLNKAAPECLALGNSCVEVTLPCDALELNSAFEHGHYEHVLSLYQGAFAHGVRFKNGSYELEEWLYATRESVAVKLRSAFLALAGNSAARGDFAHAASLADKAYHVKNAPDAEEAELWQLFTLLRAANHQSAEAVRKEAAHYGLELAVSIPEAREALSPARVTESLDQTYARYLTPFVGRDNDVREIVSQLFEPSVRLLCITGLGGAGKTRLASVILKQDKLKTTFPDGCYFIPLEALQDASLIPIEIASALNLQFTDEDLWRNLSMLLRNKRILLVLDNLEHVIDSMVVELDTLLKHCPRVTVLATSREVLNIPGEVIYELKGLRVPAHTKHDFSKYGATALFITSAKRLKYAFSVPANKAHILSICEQLEGWPLGIELAVAWVRQRSCEDIATDLQDNLDVLNTRSRSVASRHKSARAAFMHSWELLTEHERIALARLSVFKGGFTLEAADDVTQTTLPTLASLLDKSLLSLNEKDRYTMHPLVWQYSHEKLTEYADQTTVATLHCQHYLAYLKQHDAHLCSLERKTHLSLLNRELANIKAAWFYAVQLEEFEVLAESAFLLSFLRDSEAYSLFRQTVDQLDASNPQHHKVLGRALIGQALASLSNAEEHELAEKALGLLKPIDDQMGIQRALCSLFDYMSLDTTVEEKQLALAEGLKLARAFGTTADIIQWLFVKLLHQREVADFNTVRQDAEAAMRECRAFGDYLRLKGIQYLYGAYLVYNKHFEEGYHLLLDSLELKEQLGGRGAGYAELAFAALRMGKLDEAEAYALQDLKKTTELRLSQGQAKVLAYLGHIAVQRDDREAARAYFEQSLSLDILKNWRIENLVHYSAYLKAYVSPEQATQLLAFIRHSPYTEKRDRDLAVEYLKNIQALLPYDVINTAITEGEGRDFDRVVREALRVVSSA